MRIHISGKNIDVGDSLRERTARALDAAVAKYAIRPVEATATFGREGHEFTCDASVHLSTGLTAKATARESDPYGALMECLERMEKQLRRYKRRLKNHHQRREGRAVPRMDAAYSVLAPAEEMEEEETPAEDALQPVIIAESRTTLSTLSVGEAVMQMELADQPVLVFRNEANDGINVVYRRKDGNIGWIDPTQAENE
ncbi:MAG: ribosome-associated translation inhibitor RaiA [Alphaproteobacteria bacterium]|nr:MAG: ribosome-associated translation inhibitor RaiA [Alphaproteobacteria bacterium]